MDGNMSEELKRFYKTKEWQQFRKVIISERGPLCERCGQLSTDTKFIHIHHKKELTELNYMDANISLNPNNVEILCQQCHNKEHGRWCKGALKIKERGIYIVYGPPCSGKTSYVIENKRFNDIVVDMDRLYEAITLLPRYDKPDQLKYNVFAIKNLMIDNIKTKLGNFNSAWIVGGYASKYTREKLASDLGAELIYMECSKEECKARLRACNDYRQGHIKEWEVYIDNWFEEFIE